MTNEEAIETLSYMRCEYNCFDEGRRRYHALSMAIEALENNDKLAEDLQNCLEMYKKKKAEVEALKQTQWIPCEERLPEKGEEVLVYLFGDSPYIAWHDGLYWCTEDFFIGDKDEEPLAWMPLPKPYEGGTE